MIHTEQAIDWYSMTFPHETLTKDILPKNMILNMVRIKSPIPVYELAHEVLPLGIKVLHGAKRFGLHVIYSGKCLLNCRENGITDKVIWDNMIDNGGKLSRIDFALDILDDNELNVNNIKAAYDNNECQTALSGSKFIGSGDEHETLYLGNMKSKARKLRIYNKGIEQRVDYLWVRIEYEKRRQSMVAARSHFRDGNSIASIIKSVVDFPKWQKWQDAFNAEPAIFKREEKPPPDWIEKLNWLCDTCAPAMANAVRLEAEGKDDFNIEESEVLNTFASVLSAELRKKFRA